MFTILNIPRDKYIFVNRATEVYTQGSVFQKRVRFVKFNEFSYITSKYC